VCNPKVSSRHGFLNSGFVKLRKLFLNSNNDQRSGFALTLAAISAKFPPITHIFGNQIWGEMLSTAQVLVGGAKYGCMFARMRIYNKYVENVR
jgi:hypothetical protein